MKRKPESGDSVGKEESQEPTASKAFAAKRKKNKKNNAAGGVAAEEVEEFDEEEAEEHLPILKLCGDGDVCRALIERYARSSAQQHRHLCATAAAMQSILSEEGLPLTPTAYFAAVITAVLDADRADREGVAALSAFLSVVLPLVPSESLPKPKAKDAACVIVSLLRDPAGGLSTGTLRSMVKSLGLVALMLDLEDWPSIELPFETLLLFAVDKRPKVRRCAQSCLEELLKNCHSSSITKKTSKVVHRMLRKYIALVKIPYSIQPTNATLNSTMPKSEHLEALHMLNVLNTMLPYISDRVRMKILSDSYELLGCHFSWTTRHILRILEALLEQSDVKVLVHKAENIVSALTSYVSSAEKNPADTNVSASLLLKNVLTKFGDVFPTMWIRYLPLVFTSLIGYLGSDSDTSKLVANILKESINFHINQSLFRSSTGQSGDYKMESSPEASAVASICSVSYKMLKKCIFPTEHMLEVMSVLFLKLGGSSNFFMEEILLRLAQSALNVDEEKPNMKHLEQCLGAAVIAMGPEKLLSLVPIAIDMEKSTFSNSWIIPILKKYVVGATLQYFMDNIVPLAKYIQESCKKVKKESNRKSLQSCFDSLWDLLPAFCRYPIDISEKIESLSMLCVVVLKEEPSLHEIVALALQVLVHSNREDTRYCVDDPSSIFSRKFAMEFRNFRYSKKVASKNMKALAASRSMELFQILKEIFFDSPDKRQCMKDALGSLGFVIPSEYIRNFFLSELKILEQSSDLTDSESLDDHVQIENQKVGEAEAALQRNEERSCLLMELASSFVEAADTDLTNIIFDLIRSSLLDTNGVCECEAYFTLSKILKEKDSFSSAQLDDVIELLFTVKPPADASSLKNRFSCFDCLLVYMLKSHATDMDKKAFLILNEILLTLKSKKESRKLAYDLLLTVSGKLKTPHSDSADSDLLRLFSMVMGYLSSSSPHVMSGAISALSLLIYQDAAFCLSVPNLIPSVLVLLQSKANEVIKATLGFIKVLVSSLICYDLRKLLPEILQGILPWSLVSKFHFRSKVSIILEILIRKCSSEAVESQTPEKYKGFVKSIKEGRANRKLDKEASTSDFPERSADLMTKGGKKRLRDNALNPSEKPSNYKVSSSHKNTGKKPDNGFKKKSSRKMMHTDFRNQSKGAGRPDSHRQNKSWTRNTSTNYQRRYAEKQNISVVDAGTNKQRQSLDVARDKKPKGDKLPVTSKSVASSRFNKHRRKSS